MFDVLKKMLDPPKQIRRTGKIIKKSGLLRYTIEDSADRRFTAESGSSYKLGDQVVVKDGLIVGKIGKPGSQSRYYV